MTGSLKKDPFGAADKMKKKNKKIKKDVEVLCWDYWEGDERYDQ